MVKVFVQFADDAADKIVSVFACAQDPEHYPNYAELDDDDPRYLAFTARKAIPFAVTKRQGRLALLAAGKLSAVEDAIAALPSPQKEAAEIEWDGSVYERASPFVTQLGASIGLTSDELDALFVEASKL